MSACVNCGAENAGADGLCADCRSQAAAHHVNDFADGSLPPVEPGEVLDGKWRVESRLGQGGMGTVVLGHDLALDRKVAVKLLSSTMCLDDEAVARFEREARLTAKLEHPNIVPVYAVGRHGKRPFIVMKYLDGMPLSAYLRQTPQPLPDAEVQSILHQVCDGLALVHAHGFVHRDVKPANIFIAPTGLATLLDFGILKDASTSVTNAGMVMGTPAYLAPELLRGEPFDHRADLYALGVVLYELLSGTKPFSTPTLEMAQENAKRAPPDIRERAPWVSPALAYVVAKAVARAPEERFQNAQELWDAVEGAYRAPTYVPARERWPRHWPRLRWVLGGASAMLLVGALTFAFWPPPVPLPVAVPTPPPPPLPLSPPPPETPARELPAPEEPSPPSPRPRAPPKGTVSIVTREGGEPSWARLEVDGKALKGLAPQKMDLAAGRHHIRVVREGFQSIDREVEVLSGRRTVLVLDLIP